jgi:hypothetical protein
VVAFFKKTWASGACSSPDYRLERDCPFARPFCQRYARGPWFALRYGSRASPNKVSWMRPVGRCRSIESSMTPIVRQFLGTSSLGKASSICKGCIFDMEQCRRPSGRRERLELDEQSLAREESEALCKDALFFSWHYLSTIVTRQAIFGAEAKAKAALPQRVVCLSNIPPTCTIAPFSPEVACIKRLPLSIGVHKPPHPRLKAYSRLLPRAATLHRA